MVGNRAENLVDGHRTLPVLLADLAAARATIHVSIFLFFNDPIGKEIERVLCERARAGVKIRILVNLEKTEMGDPFPTGEEEMMEEDPDFPDDAMDVEALAHRLRNWGIKVLDSNLDFDRVPDTQDTKLREQARLIKETSRMDAAHVDHRKLITIDGRVVYCGSANFGAQYLFHVPFDPAVEAHEEADRVRAAKGPEPWWKWHDGFVRFEGSVARAFDAYFRERWVLDGRHAARLSKAARRRHPPLRVPEPFHPSEDGNLRRARLDRRLGEPELPQPGERQRLRARRPGRERGVRPRHQRRGPRRGLAVLPEDRGGKGRLPRPRPRSAHHVPRLAPSPLRPMAGCEGTPR